MRVLGISGSLRAGSHNTRLLRGLRALLPAGVELVEFERLGEIPPYSEDDERITPSAVAALKAAIADADAVLLATPEYNGSIPGQLKNALDWVSRPPAVSPLRSKPAAVIGASTSLFGAVWAQAELRKVLGTMGARVLDRELPLPQAEENLGADGLPLDADVVRELAETVSALLDLAGAQQLAA
jgi:chromate reductase, NAD(P)H dehydrogenase (quinone)